MKKGVKKNSVIMKVVLIGIIILAGLFIFWNIVKPFVMESCALMRLFRSGYAVPYDSELPPRMAFKEKHKKSHKRSQKKRGQDDYRQDDYQEDDYC